MVINAFIAFGKQINDMFNNVVSFNIAKLLNNRVYGDNKYATENLKVTWDNYLGTQEYKEGELIDDGDNIHGKYVMAPSIADVIDWLFEEKQIVFRFEPVYTFSTKEHIAYYFKAYINRDKESFDDLIATYKQICVYKHIELLDPLEIIK